MVARVLEAKDEDGEFLYPEVVIQIPRRATKTTTITNVLLGRCFSIPGYKVVQTGQDGARARQAFNNMASALEYAYPDEATRPFRYYRANGTERLVWDNGSVWWVVPPQARAFRGASANVIWADEAGEYDAAITAQLIEGALPLLDTVKNSQVIISGTSPATREGLLWDYLVTGRKGTEGIGIVDFSMRPDDDPTDEDVWYRVHPGLAAGLTSIKTIRKRFETMKLISFQREYLCADPQAANIAAIDPEDWLATQVDKMPEIPRGNFTLSYDVHPDGQSAAIALAYYTEAGLPHIQIVDYRAGFSWVPGELAKWMKEHRGLEVVFDSIGHNNAVFQTVQRMRGVPSQGLRPITMKDSSGGVSLLTGAIADRAIVHAEDRDLDAAVEGANFRFVNDSRLFGRRTSLEDVSPLVACANALYVAAGNTYKAPRKRREAILL
ncbi:hypothetical protein ACFUOZ_04640 [Paenarthrobacter sp. NPDC057355]|uniref:hypothetical protein n=1 Tax=Paenarthrobacter sp. NPDC057355 TaxID=3346105 RepID=UPI00363F48B7